MRLPDDLFNLVFTFLDSIEIIAWTAESVRTKHAIARKLCKIVHGLDIETGFEKCVPTGMFWAHERMLDVDVPQRSSRGIAFESALFWLPVTLKKCVLQLDTSFLAHVTSQNAFLLNDHYWILHAGCQKTLVVY